MNKIIKASASMALSLGVLVFAAPAGATITQVADVSVSPATGTGAAKGKNYVKLSSYLATRDAASNRGTMKANPVGKVVMSFPVGSTINLNATPGCNKSEYSFVAALASGCASSVIGTGWALLNTGSSSVIGQLTGAPVDCGAGDATQYSRTYRSGALGCTPMGAIWVKITAYQGGILKNQQWNHIPGVPFNKFTKTAIIFANDNGLAPLAFAGNIKNNVLTVNIPSLNGDGAGAGELTGGWVLSDFKLDITKPNYLKAGACTSSKKWVVNSKFTYSKLKGESQGPNPATTSINATSACRA